MTFDEFIDYATEILIDAFITGGFKQVKNTFRHSVMCAMYVNRKTIWRD